MIAENWLPNAVQVNMTASDKSTLNHKGIVSAQIGDRNGDSEASSLVVRFVNPRPDPVALDIVVNGRGLGTSATMWALHSEQLSDSNTPSDPTRVSPKVKKLNATTKMPVPANSFVVITVEV